MRDRIEKLKKLMEASKARVALKDLALELKIFGSTFEEQISCFRQYEQKLEPIVDNDIAILKGEDECK